MQYRISAISLLGLLLGLFSGPTLASTGVVAPQSAPFPCEWVSGRLSTYNGNPTFRIWPKGTRRILGVTSAKREDDSESLDILPPSVRRFQPGFERDLWGDFRVCPIVPERKGWMRLVVLKDARGLRAIAR